MLEKPIPPLRRELEPTPIHDRKGHAFIRLDDPLHLSDTAVFLPPPLFWLAALFDGQHTIAELYRQHRQKFREKLNEAQIQAMIKSLDEAFLLDNDRFARRLAARRQAYRKLQVRPMAFAGQSYAEEPEALAEQMRRQAAEAAAISSVRVATDRKIVGAAVPHIDPRLGGVTYAAVYRFFHTLPTNTVFVVLGISHHMMKSAFALTERPFAVPGGQVEIDRQLLHRITKHCKNDLFQDELYHLYEHSIEFQAVYLSWFVKVPFTLVPVLCSFTFPMKETERRQYEEFLQAVQAAAAEESRHVVYIAAVDLSHIGPLYGSQWAPDAFQLAQVEETDKKLLDAFMRRDTAAFDLVFEQKAAQNNVCGFPAMRTLLPLLPPSEGVLIAYDNAIMDEFRSTVTFAGVLFVR
ncbi:MAG: AmmeMemoRadiSam system protein B [candidate division KSB1 bacterium]|nr:AmmeMemoRadiSam system protein B [candidate division KSB1 bacterium]